VPTPLVATLAKTGVSSTVVIVSPATKAVPEICFTKIVFGSPVPASASYTTTT